MNTLRSTERHLTLITFQRKIAPRNIATAASLPLKSKENAVKPRYRRTISITTSKYDRSTWQPHRKIKFFESLKDTSIRNHSTSSLPEISLLNPNKIEPKDLKELAIQPLIQPLTNPRFGKDKLNQIPSVTRVLSATTPAASQYILDRWKEAMIRKLGMAGFNKYQAETFERGRLLHALLEKYLLNNIEPTNGQGELTTEIVQNLWKSIEKVIRDKIKNVRLVEHTVTHPTLNYRGIVDCVACYEDELVVIDFKTAEKPKKTVESLYDNPLQVTAYCGAINCDPRIPDSIIDRNICSGLVIVAYIDGSEASTYHLGRDQVSEYWKQWTIRLEQYTRLEEMRKVEKKN